LHGDGLAGHAMQREQRLDGHAAGSDASRDDQPRTDAAQHFPVNADDDGCQKR